MNLMTKTGKLLLCLTLAALSAQAAAQQVFFGEDLNTGGTARLAATPNADAARDAFLARLAQAGTNTGGAGTEDFDGFSDGTTAPLPLTFGAVTATVTAPSGMVTAVAPGANNGDGRYPISDPNYWDTDREFTIDFSSPVQGLGFYGIDMGDFQGRLSLRLTLEGGGFQDVDIAHTLGADDASVLYFGVVSLTPITSATFANSTSLDVFGFDDFTVQQFVPLSGSGDASIPSLSHLGLILMAGLLGLFGLVSARRS